MHRGWADYYFAVVDVDGYYCFVLMMMTMMLVPRQTLHIVQPRRQRGGSLMQIGGEPPMLLSLLRSSYVLVDIGIVTALLSFSSSASAVVLLTALTLIFRGKDR